MPDTPVEILNKIINRNAPHETPIGPASPFKEIDKAINQLGLGDLFQYLEQSGNKTLSRKLEDSCRDLRISVLKNLGPALRSADSETLNKILVESLKDSEKRLALHEKLFSKNPDEKLAAITILEELVKQSISDPKQSNLHPIAVLLAKCHKDIDRALTKFEKQILEIKEHIRLECYPFIKAAPHPLLQTEFKPQVEAAKPVQAPKFIIAQQADSYPSFTNKLLEAIAESCMKVGEAAKKEQIKHSEENQILVAKALHEQQEQVEKLARDFPELKETLLKKYLPGPFTVASCWDLLTDIKALDLRLRAAREREAEEKGANKESHFS